MADVATVKAFVSGHDYIQDIHLEPGIYTALMKVKSMYGDVVSFALHDADGWKHYDMDTVQGEWKWAYVTFRILKEVDKFKLMSRYYDSTHPVYAVHPQIVAGNTPVDAGASPFDLDQITDDLHDLVHGIEDFTNDEFADRALSESERVSLRHDLENVNIIVESVKGSYEKVVDNPYIDEDTRDDITLKYNTFIDSWDSLDEPKGLKTVIEEIIAGDEIISDQEMSDKNVALMAFNIALFNYNKAEKAIVGIRGVDGKGVEFIFRATLTDEPPSVPEADEEGFQQDDYTGPDWVDDAFNATEDMPFVWVAERKKVNGVWSIFCAASLWDKWVEDGISVNLLVEGHYKSHWEGTTKVTEIVGGINVEGSEVVKVSAVFRKGEENIAATVAQSRGFQWYVNGEHLASFDNQPYITLDETYGDGFADYVVLSYLVNSIREEERREIINISEGMDGIGEEFIFKANNSDTVPPVLPQTTDPNYQDDDYYGQGTASEWNDDPVAPTELNQFVWVAKRKKVGGIWEAFGTPSVWTRWVEDGDPGAGIDTVTDYYAVSTSGTTPPTTWYTTMPAKSANEYLWNYEVVTYTDNRTPTETEKRVIQGKDARSIYDIKNAYAYSASDTVSPTSGWQYSIAALGTKPAGYFLWIRDDIAYTDNPSNYIGTIGYVVRDGDDAKTLKITASSTSIKVTQGGSIPATITLTVTAVNTSVGAWWYSINGATFTTSTPDYVTVASPTAQQATINCASAEFRTLTVKVVKTADNAVDTITINREGGSPYLDETTETWWEWNDNLYDDYGGYANTGYGAVGAAGATPYPAGYYDPTKTYERTADYVPYVQYGGTLYLLKRVGTCTGKQPDLHLTAPDDYWVTFLHWQAIIADSLVAAFAKIGGSVFTGDTSETASSIRGRQISEKGEDGTTNYQNYTGDSSTWQPKLMLDFLNGKVKFSDADVKGKITATSGELGGFDVGSNRIGTVVDDYGGSAGGMSLYDNFIVFNTTNKQALVGPISMLGVPMLGRLTDTASFYSTKWGLIIDVRNGERNVALSVIGDSLFKGSIVHADGYYTSAGAINSIYDTIDRFTKYLFNPASGNANIVYVPTGAQIVSKIGTDGLPTNWCLDIDVSVYYTSGGAILLRGQSGGYIGDNNGGIASHNDSHTYGGIKMEKGDHVKLRYFSSMYRWQIIDHNK